MPSARMPKEGVMGLGAARTSSYGVYGLSFQCFNQLELSLNYDARLSKDSSQRRGNIKFCLPQWNSHLPLIAFGMGDFLGEKPFNSEYIVLF